MDEELEKSDIKWLEEVIKSGKLLETFDLRKANGEHSKSERIEIYYYENLFEDNELTVFIKFDNDKIVGYETY